MHKWRKALALLTVVAILGISLGYPARQLIQQWSQDHPVVVVQEREEGGHEHENADDLVEPEPEGEHEHDSAPSGGHEDEHEEETHQHHHDPSPEPDHEPDGHDHGNGEGEAEHLKPAFETYGLVRSEPGYKEFNVKLSQFSFEPNTIRVHKGDLVRLNLDAVDVEHGLEIDGYDGTVSVPVEKVVTVEFMATDGGAMRFRCSVTCGAFHPFMVGRIIVEPDTTFPWAMFLVGAAPLALLGGYILWRRM